MKYTTAVIIVTYNPDEQIFNTINYLLDIEDCLIIIIDNNSMNSKSVMDFKKQEKITFKQLDQNVGLAKAQNIGLEIARNQGFKYILLLDQDTEIDRQLVSKLENDFQKLKKVDKRLGVLVPVYVEKKTKKAASYTVRDKNGKYVKRLLNDEENFMKIAFSNASGMFFETCLIDDIGMMFEDFFVDQIDVEFCMRLKKFGYNIYATRSVSVEHTVGEGEVIQVGLFQLKLDNHSSMRKYYIFRNSFILKDLYSKDINFLKLINKRLIKNVITVLFEKNRLTKFRAMVRGRFDAKGYIYSKK